MRSAAMPRSAMKRAVGLGDGREGQGADERHLTPQEIAADVEGDGVALADEAGLAPGAHAAHRLPARERRGRGVERQVGAEPAGEIPDGVTTSSTAAGSIVAAAPNSVARARR